MGPAGQGIFLLQSRMPLLTAAFPALTPDKQKPAFTADYIQALGQAGRNTRCLVYFG